MLTTLTRHLKIPSAIAFLKKAAVLMTVFMSISTVVLATHFRYGNISWRSLGGRTIEFQISQAWRQTAFFFSPPAIGTTVNVSGSATFEFGDGTTSPIILTVTSVNPAEDWFFGTTTITHTYATDGAFTAFWFSGDRISELENNADGLYRVSTRVVVGGPANNSPVSTVLPIIDLPVNNAAASFTVPAIDPEGTPLSFRLATSFEASGDATGYVHPPGLTVNPTTGQVIFPTTGQTLGDLFTTQIIISDGNSQIAVDFIIRVSQGGGGGTDPFFDYSTTPANGSVITVAPGSNVSFNVLARDNDAGATVSLIAAGVPVGATFMPALPASGNPVSTVFNWTPGAAALGSSFIIQFQATDNTSRSANTSVTINVRNVPPPCNLTTSATATPAPSTTSTEGTAQISASGGSGSYQFSLGGTTNTTGMFTGLGSNTYPYTVEDIVTGCRATGSVTVPFKPCITTTTTSTPANSGMSDGSVTITATGDFPPFTFQLNGTAMSNNTGVFTGLSAGTYTFTVSDSRIPPCPVTVTVPVGTRTVVPPADVDCLNDTIILAGSNCMATINWSAPSRMYPDTINITPGAGPARGKLVYKGTYNGHGYYESTDYYLWPDARAMSTSLGGHLVTIADAAENSFIYSNFRQVNNYGPWLGLYNTGTPGSFAWVTGEPVTFTYWNPGEPSNQGGNATTVTEPYVHIMGYDFLNRWNDLPNFTLGFIAEFENPVLTYTQISGPAMGSMQSAGVYTICYQRTNSATGMMDTCCFNVTVLCNATTSACPKDTVITADPNTCMATVAWTEPTGGFSNNISIPGGQLTLKGVYNGHGYYLSDGLYNWNPAKSAAESAGGHLVTITDAAENNFIYNTFRQGPGYGPWIGLYNTGTPGSFAWVTGEPVSFTYWNAFEPNNNNGSATLIYEPYVHIMGFDYLNRWNDMIDIGLHFIAEIEAPTFVYRQIQGPANGSMQMPGVYTICYERRDTANNTTDTCCFTVTVNCASPTMVSNNRRNTATLQDVSAKGFVAKAYPNPTNSSFTLQLQSDNSKDRISVRVMDLYGRIIEVRDGIAPNTTIKFGGNYRPGAYLTQVIQGTKRVTFKLIKQ